MDGQELAAQVDDVRGVEVGADTGGQLDTSPLGRRRVRASTPAAATVGDQGQLGEQGYEAGGQDPGTDELAGQRDDASRSAGLGVRWVSPMSASWLGDRAARPLVLGIEAAGRLVTGARVGAGVGTIVVPVGRKLVWVFGADATGTACEGGGAGFAGVGGAGSDAGGGPGTTRVFTAESGMTRTQPG